MLNEPDMSGQMTYKLVRGPGGADGGALVDGGLGQRVVAELVT